MMMHRAFGLICGLCTAGVAWAAVAQDRPVVVELYTSQGCSSCPSADALFERMTDDPSLIPLALHVDYWDYIGWTDVFGNPQFTQRQKAYASAVGSRMIYTPQMIVNGTARVEGNDPDAVAAAIAQARGLPPQVQLSLERHGGQLYLKASTGGQSGPMVVQLVRYMPQETVAIKHGENAGKTVTYRNIVTKWQRVADWTGEPPLDMVLPIEGDQPAVVLLQQQGPGNILAAARVE